MLAFEFSGEKSELWHGGDRDAAVKFDWRQMQRWKISESTASAREQILFREPPSLGTHRWQIVAIAAVILAQAALILWLLWEHRRRRRLEVEGRQRMAELAHMNRQATAGHLSASIAHELNQPLGAILNNVEAAELMITSPSPNLQELETILDDIQRDDERASKVIKRLRRLLTKGAAFDPQEVDLNKVVRDVVRIASAQAAARDVRLDSNLAQLPLRVKRGQGPAPAGDFEPDRQWDRCHCRDAKRRARDRL